MTKVKINIIKTIEGYKLNFKKYKKVKSLKIFFRIIKRNILKLLNTPQVAKIFICPSHQCNADCVHCLEKFAHDKFHSSLTTLQIKNIINQFKKLGGCHIYFCSGEFLLREDTLEIINYAHRKAMYTSITTNGILATEEKIKQLKTAGLNELNVSIDSANPQTHDKLRGVAGCFEKAINAIKLAKKERLDTQIWTYVSKSHTHELEEILNLGKKLNTHVFVFFPNLSGRYFNQPEENLTLEERENFRKKFNGKKGIRLEFPKETSLCRGGGREHICVMPSGDVTFCPPVPYSYGHIDQKKLKDCLKDIMKDYDHFCLHGKCNGQCIVNFQEYQKNCNAKFIY